MWGMGCPVPVGFVLLWPNINHSQIKTQKNIDELVSMLWPHLFCSSAFGSMWSYGPNCLVEIYRLSSFVDLAFMILACTNCPRSGCRDCRPSEAARITCV